VNLSNIVVATLDSEQGAPSIDNFCSSTPGECIQVVNNTGQVEPGLGRPLAVTGTVRSVAASMGKAPETFFSTTRDSIEVREVVAALAPGFMYRNVAGPPNSPMAGHSSSPRR